MQLYIAADLNVPHYQDGQQELKEYKKKLSVHSKKHPTSKLLSRWHILVIYTNKAMKVTCQEETCILIEAYAVGKIKDAVQNSWVSPYLIYIPLNYLYHLKIVLFVTWERKC
eukprot:7310729-Ditylum_brightwellii.AAC.1